MSKQKYPQASTSTNVSGTPRSGREHYSSAKLHAKRDRKRREAFERQDKYDLLTIEEKMKYAGKKELAKLQKKLAAQTAPAVKIAPLTEAQKSAKAVKRAQDAVAALPMPKKKKLSKASKE
jgi:hypothetical protein